MARTTGPLFSFDASGTVAGAVVFSKWRGRNYVRRHAIPMNPRSVKQVSVREMLAFLSRQWQGFSDPDQASWTVPAKAKNYLLFNAYIAANMTSWKHGEYPSQVYPRNPISTPPGGGTLSAVGGVRILTLTYSMGSPVADWGIAIHMATTTGFTPSRANLVGIIAADATPLVLAVAPLAPDAYFAAAIPFNVDGIAGSPSNEATDTVT